MKRILLLLLIAISCVMFVGCKNNENAKKENNSEILVEDDEVETFEIKTSVVSLRFPTKWKDIVDIKTNENTVSFSIGDTKVFDVVFKTCEGNLLGEYNGTPIYIISYPVNTSEQANMQEDINVILENLLKDKNFVINKE